MKKKMNLAQFIIYIESFNANVNIPLIRKAYEFSDKAHSNQLRETGDPFIEHCLEVAFILAEQHMDSTTIAAGMLHDVVEDTSITLDEVRKEFGDEIAHMVNGLTKLSSLSYKSTTDKQVEYFRKMLLSMSEDIRVIIIKLADRLHNMKTLAPLHPAKKIAIATETKEIYAPLAHRLGMAKIKCDLEDLAFAALEPKNYAFLERKVREGLEEREAYIKEVSEPLRIALENEGIVAEISGRAKHLDSIWRKMQKRQVPFEQIYDLFAIRAVVENEKDCYHALGVVHSTWKPVMERFHDYIANVKSNMYQSLHTTVIGPRNRMVEIQIRTKAMHYRAEYGIAAHWLYKEGKRKYDESDKRMAWVREVLEWQKELTSSEDFLEFLKVDLFQDDIFVYTPTGELKHLPKGSTPLDFGFAIHSDVGFHCTGAKINGKFVPIMTPLESGQVVEIQTSPHQHPSIDWLKIVKTGAAKSKIKHWIVQQGYTQAVSLGREILERELRQKRVKMPSDNQLLDIAQAMGYTEADQLLAKLSAGVVSVSAILARIEPINPPKDESLISKLALSARRHPRGIKVKGADNLMFRFGACCQPLPGENITGFITRGRGVTVHRQDCPIVAAINEPDRKVDLEWDVRLGESFLIRLEILVHDRKNILKDITDAISSLDVNVRAAEIKSERKASVGSTAIGHFILEIVNAAQLRKVYDKIKKIQGVLTVERTKGLTSDD
jgi:GTP diphosphokinase / guanosine-3',5'-bis(diphosphate) 3'-diphosphatase